MRIALPRLDSRHLRLFLATVLAVFGCLVLWKTAHAAVGDPVDNAVNWILWKLIELIMWIIDLVGSLVLFLVSLLISVAKYNNFVNAAPVMTGWVLVRDTVNMFFIVVLLVVSFSTIIGYETREFGVKENLPRLLLYAVLINFSKTLVGVLIDFSQVIMLTFVNGFQAAAGGNFINALKLTKILSLAQKGVKDAAAGSQPTQTMPNLLAASLLGLTMLMISASVILVLCVYLIFRIVGLWILLILSPMAFFALALPGKLKKGLDTFTGKWWSRLSAMLTGGPIVAFFLWLTLATVQGGTTGANPFGELYSVPDSELKQTSVTITEAGSPDQLASFIVAIVMLLAGLEAAISSTQAISQEGWKRLQQAKGVAIRATSRAAKFGVRAGVATGIGTARFIDQRTGASAWAGQRLQAYGASAASKGGVTAALLAPSLMKAGNAVSGISGARTSAFSAKTEKTMKGMNAEQQQNYIKGELAAARFSKNREKEGVLAEMLQKREISKAGQGLFKGKFEKEWLGNNVPAGREATADQKRTAKAFAEGKMQREVAGRMDALEKSYRDRGDNESADKISSDRDKNPALYNDMKALNGFMEGKSDFETLTKDINVKSLQDSAAAAAYAKTGGFLDKDGKPLDQSTIEDLDSWKEVKKNKAREAIMRDQLAHWRTPEGSAALAGHFAELSGKEGAASSAGQRYRMEGGRAIPIGTEAAVSAAPTVASYAAPVAVSSYDDLTQAISPATKQKFSAAYSPERREAIASRFSAPIDDRRAELLTQNAAIVNGVGSPDPAAYASSIASMQSMDIPSDVAAGFDLSSGSYLDRAGGAAAHASAYQNAFSDMSSGDADKSVAAMDFVSNSNPQALSSDNEMSKVVIKQLTDNMENLSKGMAHATKQHQEKLQAMLGQLQKQMDAADARLKAAGGSATPNAYDESLWKLRDAMKSKGGKVVAKMAEKGAKKA